MQLENRKRAREKRPPCRQNNSGWAQCPMRKPGWCVTSPETRRPALSTTGTEGVLSLRCKVCSQEFSPIHAAHQATCSSDLRKEMTIVKGYLFMRRHRMTKRALTSHQILASEQKSLNYRRGQERIAKDQGNGDLEWKIRANKMQLGVWWRRGCQAREIGFSSLGQQPSPPSPFLEAE